jgi:hypothetical protein
MSDLFHEAVPDEFITHTFAFFASLRMTIAFLSSPSVIPSAVEGSRAVIGVQETILARPSACRWTKGQLLRLADEARSLRFGRDDIPATAFSEESPRPRKRQSSRSGD